ncbi:MAG: hypothetical protein ACE5FW_02420 [Candidatus Aenigmatarchaeota archaeon]
MKLTHSEHWKRKRCYRKDVTDALIEYAITNSGALRDRYWINALNAICRVPPSGRILKVVYRKLGKDEVKIITAYWLD